MGKRPVVPMKDVEKIVEHYNSVFGRKVRSVKGFIDNYNYWADDYTPDDIMLAITNARRDPFWSDKLTLTILFRRKNPRGEPVDNIGMFLNAPTAKPRNIFVV